MKKRISIKELKRAVRALHCFRLWRKRTGLSVNAFVRSRRKAASDRLIFFLRVQDMLGLAPRPSMSIGTETLSAFLDEARGNSVARQCFPPEKLSSAELGGIMARPPDPAKPSPAVAILGKTREQLEKDLRDACTHILSEERKQETQARRDGTYMHKYIQGIPVPDHLIGALGSLPLTQEQIMFRKTRSIGKSVAISAVCLVLPDDHKKKEGEHD